MADPVTTRPSLLVRIRDAKDSLAWSQFVELYAPLVYRFARKQGLQDADAADLTQEVLRTVSSAIGRLDYDPQRGSFRSWLFTVVRSKLSNFLAKQRHLARGTGDTTANQLLDLQPARPEGQDELWRQEYEQRLFAWAAEQVKSDFQESTWLAFWKTAVEGKSGKEVSSELGMTVAAVYLARSRVTAKLRERVRAIAEEGDP